MNPNPWPSTYDRDLDVPRRPARGPNEPLDPYRRLVANPLPSVGCGVLAVMILRSSLESRNVVGFLTAIGLLSVALLFTQFHCLDCGTTTWLFSSRRHACAAALARWREGRRSRWPFPGIKTQMILWFYLLASVGMLMLILLGSRR